MTKPYRLTSRAEREFTDIVTQVAADDLDAADRVIAKFERAFQQLADLPGIGHRREDLSLDDRVRFWRVHSYLVVYLVGTDPLRIVRVLSGYRDVAQELADDV